MQEVKTSLAGGTVGYTDLLMNFWNEDFQFLAAAPNRAVGIVCYEHPVARDLMLAVAVESGLPTSVQKTEGLRSLDFNAPLLTSRLRYTNDDVGTFQLAGLVLRETEQLDVSLPVRPASFTTETGWASTVGATVPTKFIGADDYVSGQATYAVNAAPLIGTNADLAVLPSVAPLNFPTHGWSAAASFHHQWSEQWESNVFASYLSIDITATDAQPTVRTTRYAINLYWRPDWTTVGTLRFGVELGSVETARSLNGPTGALSDVTGKALVGYLDAEWSF